MYNLLITLSGVIIPELVIGGMKWTSHLYGQVDLEQSTKTIQAALNKGFIHIDTADCYLGSGTFPHNELFIGLELIKYFKKKQSNRSKVFISTKCGFKINPKNSVACEIDNSPEYILRSCEASLTRLNMQYIDLFYLHRINEKSAKIEDSMYAMHQLRSAGKIRYIGISEANPELIQRADTALKRFSHNKYGLSAVQTEYNLLRRSPETDGVFEICKRLGINFFAYSPLCRGLTTDSELILAANDCRNHLSRYQGDNLIYNKSVIDKARNFAKIKQCSLAQLSLAWIFAKKNLFDLRIYPIIGTANPQHLLENIQSLKIVLESKDILKIDTIAPLGIAKGLRYSLADMKKLSLTN